MLFLGTNVTTKLSCRGQEAAASSSCVSRSLVYNIGICIEISSFNSCVRSELKVVTSQLVLRGSLHTRLASWERCHIPQMISQGEYRIQII